MIYSGRYDSGDYVTVRNIRTTAEEAARYFWAQRRRLPQGASQRSGMILRNTGTSFQ